MFVDRRAQVFVTATMSSMRPPNRPLGLIPGLARSATSPLREGPGSVSAGSAQAGEQGVLSALTHPGVLPAIQPTRRLIQTQKSRRVSLIRRIEELLGQLKRLEDQP